MRWKFVIPSFIIIAAVVAVNILFLDTFIRKALIAGGEKAFGAKVEIAGVKTRLRNMSVAINGVAVADKDNRWRNVFETESLRFSMEPLPLLSKKVIINEMSVAGIRWGTQRATSGALPPRKLKKIAAARGREDENSATSRLLNKLKEKGKSEIASLPALQTVENAQNALKDISVDKALASLALQSPAEIEKIKTDISERSAQFSAGVEGLQIDEKTAKAGALLNELKEVRIQNLSDLEQIRSKIDEINRTKDELEKTYKDVQSLQSQVSSAFGDTKNILARLEEAKNRDFQSLMSKMQLPTFSYNNIAQALFGQMWINRVNSVIHYIHLARKYMPARSGKDKKVARQRLRGIDVKFPKENALPDFLIRTVSLSGTTGGPGKTGEALDFKGVAANITSDPVLLGKPVTAVIVGTQGTKRLNLGAAFDHTTANTTDRIDISYVGLPAKDFNIPSSEYLPAFNEGTVGITSSFMLKSSATVDCYMDAVLSGINASAGINEIAAQLWKGVTEIKIHSALAGSMDNPALSVSSNLDDILSANIKNLYGEKLAEVQNKARAEIDRLTLEKKRELLAQAASAKETILNQIMANQKEIRYTMDALTGKREEIDNQIRSKADEEKKKAEEEIKKKAVEQLQNLFK